MMSGSEHDPGDYENDPRVAYLQATISRYRKMPKLRIKVAEPSTGLTGYREKLREKLARTEARMVELIQTRVDDGELRWLVGELEQLDVKRDALLEALA